MLIRLSSLFVWCLLLSASASCEQLASNDSDEERARQVLESTKSVRGTYALYSWNWMTIPGSEPTEGWSAEFHSGDKHRVETPRHRIIADCRLGTGSIIDLSSDKVEHGDWIAEAACGVNTNKPILELDWVGEVSTDFGTADRVTVVDRENIRSYDVSPEGLLFASTYAENTPEARVLLKTEAIQLKRVLPDANIFEPESLDESFVPIEFRVAPEDD